ncbi:DUF6069 family protein [Actinoplanes sp. GCM10030250]|uniref:DUF6069 family protein n=1 Tax=Actinoplanes sp. GCM10030250 TaxID=3273376 RepID=UPI0036209E5E
MTNGISVVAAVALNLAVYAVGRAAGGSFRFTSAGEPAEVDPLARCHLTLAPTVVVAVLAIRARVLGGDRSVKQKV